MNHPNTPKHFLSNRQDAPAYWQVDILWILHASSQQTGGAYTLLEQYCPKNSGAPPHYHDQGVTGAMRSYLRSVTVTRSRQGRKN